ncbi:MAG: hypothetical protein COS82_05695 [Zetaproteobacteria bacterium CG06_land_8_20_14_3_00_59_53]|nr:MAG: hypothetical protein AUK36_06595 [Zetaproteobacteria bacterium CG2_30_59_37]PIO90789.1 MAG: hypothetical protein COX56_00825 [Zetaproteobacteria bacterium CG23_combo_of_CG06-09_8_20_14_all_59_86]PIQ64916.1 MAG: hypothetical protein COV97_06590 [Zetaproteobacteria bacterium CG11_big_fil_rev_8_21_14_0_20_59_439]PIU70564.1 MAG: hypothetical protein COS82_05695 [Zetaproteobacteria bacterium CG06_land_8_20_14_3_00_59_53]PIU95942.1 MAG: hypothetical protein COS62_11520 [Zetaproteobacteria bac
MLIFEDAFYDFFRPYRHKGANHDIWGGLGLESFGADLELVKQLPATHVWSVVDGSVTADQWILTGIHTVNRICFLVTEVPHNWQEIEFRIPSRGYSLTRLGLLRQTNKIKRSMTLS